MGKQVKWGILSALLMAGMFAAVWYATLPLTRTAEEFLTRVADREFNEAFALLAIGELTEEEWVTEMHHPLVDLGRLEAVSWGTREIRLKTGDLEGTLIARDGSRRGITVRLEKDSGDWRIREVALGSGWRAVSNIYRNDEHRYSIVLPDNWNITIQRDESFDAIAENPNGGSLDPISEAVSVLGEEIPEGMSLAKYGAAYEDTWDELLEIRSIDVDDIRVNGLPGRRYFIRHRELGAEGIGEAYLFVKGDRGYVILFTARSRTILTYQPLFEAVVRSFRVG
jgi:hypothetical protein